MGRSHVNDAADFARVLAEAQRMTRSLLSGGDFAPLQSVALQLDAMQAWTADGRVPSEEERASIQLGVVVFRELEPAPTPELYEYNQRLYELNGFFKEWT